MKTLTLNLKRIYFDQILSGEKTHEYRDIFPENAKKFVYYTIGDQAFAADAELPSEEECPGDVIPHPVRYDYIKFLKEHKDKLDVYCCLRSEAHV